MIYRIIGSKDNNRDKLNLTTSADGLFIDNGIQVNWIDNFGKIDKITIAVEGNIKDFELQDYKNGDCWLRRKVT